MSIFPQNYVRTADEPDSGSRYFNPKKIPDGKTATLRLCGTPDSGHVIFGYSYFTLEGRPRRFPTFPKDYLNDIGLTFEGKNKGTGEKDRPTAFLSWVCLSKEAGDFVILEITQKKVREQVEAILDMEDYTIESGEMANFFLTIKRSGTGTDTSYQVVPTLKVAPKADQDRWHKERSGIWLPALLEGGDPFCGQPSEGGPTSVVPLSHRDELGADEEVAVGAGSAESWG